MTNTTAPAILAELDRTMSATGTVTRAAYDAAFAALVAEFSTVIPKQKREPGREAELARSIRAVESDARATLASYQIA